MRNPQTDATHRPLPQPGEFESQFGRLYPNLDDVEAFYYAQEIADATQRGTIFSLDDELAVMRRYLSRRVCGR